MMSAYSKELLLNEFVIPEDPEENSETSSADDYSLYIRKDKGDKFTQKRKSLNGYYLLMRMERRLMLCTSQNISDSQQNSFAKCPEAPRSQMYLKRRL